MAQGEVVLHSVNWPVVFSLPDQIAITDGVAVPAEVASVCAWAAGVLPLLLIKVRYLALFGSDIEKKCKAMGSNLVEF